MRWSGKLYHYTGCSKHNLAGGSARGLWNCVANSIKGEGEGETDLNPRVAKMFPPI